MNLKKRLLVSVLAASLLAPTTLATFENTNGTITASAAKHKAKHHKQAKKTTKKHHKKGKKATKTNPTNSSTQPTTQTQPTTAQNSDEQTYNNAVNPLTQYANPTNLTSFAVGNGTRFSTGDSNKDIVNSLNDLAANMGSSDAYDAQMYGNSAILAFQQQAIQLYQGFKGRFSSFDNDAITSAANTIQQNWTTASSSSASVNSQWTNVKILLNDLSNAFSKLN